jgi:hypothetical protein
VVGWLIEDVAARGPIAKVRLIVKIEITRLIITEGKRISSIRIIMDLLIDIYTELWLIQLVRLNDNFVIVFEVVGRIIISDLI